MRKFLLAASGAAMALIVATAAQASGPDKNAGYWSYPGQPGTQMTATETFHKGDWTKSPACAMYGHFQYVSFDNGKEKVKVLACPSIKR